MECVYMSKHGKIIKKCPGLHEYWYKGNLVAQGSSLSCPNPAYKPTKDDWAYCASLRAESRCMTKGDAIFAVSDT